MSRDEATPRDEEFAALLAAYDDALAAGAAPARDAPAELRPRLDNDLECLYLLDRLRPPPPPEVPPAPGPDAAEPGERYTPIRLHGVGGIGEVWLVHDADLGRDVALKELRAERARDPVIAARFLREARITG